MKHRLARWLRKRADRLDPPKSAMRIYDNTVTNSTASAITVTMTPTIAADVYRAAGRRAVRKHTDALRRLGGL